MIIKFMTGHKKDFSFSLFSECSPLRICESVLDFCGSALYVFPFVFSMNALLHCVLRAMASIFLRKRTWIILNLILPSGYFYCDDGDDEASNCLETGARPGRQQRPMWCANISFVKHFCYADAKHHRPEWRARIEKKMTSSSEGLIHHSADFIK